MPPPGSTQFTIPLKVIRLEIRRGYDDRAVIGGLGAFMASWARNAARAADQGLRPRLERIAQAFSIYAQLPVPERADLCQRTLTALESYGRRLGCSGGPQVLQPESDVRHLAGVGPRRAEALASLGIRNVGQLLRHFPVRYDDRRTMLTAAELQHRQMASLQVTVTGHGQVRKRPGHSTTHVPATDGVTPLTLVWFNQPYRATQFSTGTTLLVRGQVMLRQGEVSLVVAEAERVAGGTEQSLSVGRIVPIYQLAPGLGQALVRGLVSCALRSCDPPPQSVVPDDVAQARGLCPLIEALRQVHFPASENELQAARRRIAYEELFLLQVGLARRKREVSSAPVDVSLPVAGLVDRFVSALPFAVTRAQRRVMEEIAGDLGQPQATARLLHGDVGSGKTVCAAFALLAAAQAGKQGALMAPTELLAEQHSRVVGELLAPFGVQVRLLTGSQTAASRRQSARALEDDPAAVVVGTHALFQRHVVYRDLRVVVVDEQHRFGVRQRAELQAKGLFPHVLLMSATPIPRTLALTTYGDFDVSVLDELPPGRSPVHTVLAWGSERRRAYETLCARVAAGRQAYVVCPLVDGGQESLLAAAHREFQRLGSGPFAAFRLGLLHGRMDPQERASVMEAFRRGEIEILVATTVIEVGVDVPNATVMLIENAERFGLAQLHQLRGRVARGAHEGLCVLMTRARAPEVIERLRVLTRTGDGFEIAEEDLRRRGPGEMAGTRQSGLPDLRMADLLTDMPILAQARADAFALVQRDPDLAAPGHARLRHVLQEQLPNRAWAL